MSIRCVTIDDEPLALVLMKEYISRIPALKLVGSFDDAIAGSEFLRHNKVDLLFLDINMPDISGLELAQKLDHKPMIIFTTAYKEFAMEGFELSAVDYLLKPITIDRFTKAANKAIEILKLKKTTVKDDDEALFVRSEYTLVKIPLSSIEYIESVQDYLKIHQTGARPVMTLMTLKSIIDKLPPEKFRRIHRSYVVPLSKVTSVGQRKLFIGQTELPISDTYYNEIKEWVNKPR
jgi:two-component system, LytTR family, response regulator